MCYDLCKFFLLKWNGREKGKYNFIHGGQENLNIFLTFVSLNNKYGVISQFVHVFYALSYLRCFWFFCRFNMAIKTTAFLLLCLFALASSRWIDVPEERFDALIGKREPTCYGMYSNCGSTRTCCPGLSCKTDYMPPQCGYWKTRGLETILLEWFQRFTKDTECL